MTPLVVIRPEPGCTATVAAARAARIEAHGFPLFEVAAQRWQCPDSHAFDAVLAGSANVFRHGGAQLGALRNLPVLAVGQATADAAQQAGFAIERTGSGGLQALLDGLDKRPRRLLRLTGTERIALHPPRHFAIEERVVYTVKARPFPTALIALLHEPMLIALHSAEAARHFAEQCAAHAIRRSHLRIAALGPRIAQAAGDGWGEVAAALHPDDTALLALARQMCQDPWPGTQTSR